MSKFNVESAKSKTPLSVRWAQMSKQEQIIEKKKMEIQAKFEAQRRAAHAAKLMAKADDIKGVKPTAANAFSNDGSFLDQFKKLVESKEKPPEIPEPVATIENDVAKEESSNQPKPKNLAETSTPEDTSPPANKPTEQTRNEDKKEQRRDFRNSDRRFDRGDRSQRHWNANDRGSGGARQQDNHQYPQQTPPKLSIPSLMQNPILPPGVQPYNSAPSKINSAMYQNNPPFPHMQKHSNDSGNNQGGMRNANCPPFPPPFNMPRPNFIPPSSGNANDPLQQSNAPASFLTPNVPSTNLLPPPPNFSSSGPIPPNFPPPAPTPPIFTSSGPTPPNFLSSGSTPPNFSSSGPTPPNFSPSCPAPPNFSSSGPAAPNFSSSGPTPNFHSSGPTPPNFPPSGPTPNFSSFNPTPPNFSSSGPPLPCNMHNQQPTFTFMTPNFQTQTNPVNIPFAPPLPPNPAGGKIVSMNQNNSPESMVLPPPQSELQNIPPPAMLNQLPKAEFDICNIPAPPHSVLSADTRVTPAMEDAAKQVARAGHLWENMLKSRSSQDSALWFLQDEKSVEFNLYQSLVKRYHKEIIEQEQKTNNQPPIPKEEKYDPEFSLHDEDSGDGYGEDNKFQVNSENDKHEIGNIRDRGFDNRMEDRFDNRREGGFGNRRDDKFDNRRDGGFENRRDGGFDNRSDGGFDNRRNYGFGNRRDGGFDNRGDGAFDNRCDAFDNSHNSGYENRRDDGFNNKRGGGFKNGRDSGFENRRDDGFDYNTGGGFDNRRGGGFQNTRDDDFDNETGSGYDNRRGGGFDNRRGGGFDNRRDGRANDDRREGDFDDRRNTDFDYRRDAEVENRRDSNFDNNRRDLYDSKDSLSKAGFGSQSHNFDKRADTSSDHKKDIKRDRKKSDSDGDGDSKAEKRRKRKSRWGGEEAQSADVGVPGLACISSLGAAATAALPSVPPLVPARPGDPMLLSRVTRTDPALLQYARMNYGSTNLTEEEWGKCEDNYKLNLLYQDMMRKKQELERLASAGRHKLEYDSDEDTDQGTWEHKLRAAEIEATKQWATELTKRAAGKHHIGDFLPPEELKKFMEKYSAIKSGKEPDLSDYKEFKLGEDNIGFQMLQKLGWNQGAGLGAEGTGIVEPVNKASQRDTKQGLGMASMDDLAAGDDEFDAYRKRMMMAYRFRPNPLNNPRRPYY